MTASAIILDLQQDYDERASEVRGFMAPPTPAAQAL
jgi:hypothetical protein